MTECVAVHSQRVSAVPRRGRSLSVHPVAGLRVRETEEPTAVSFAFG